jgi:hypothetical protein
MQFLQRSKALSLWRQIIRSTRRISDPTSRKETRQLARDEFERNREVTDIVSAFLVLKRSKGDTRGRMESRSNGWGSELT